MPWYIKDKKTLYGSMKHEDVLASDNVYLTQTEALIALEQQLKQLEIEEQPEIDMAIQAAVDEDYRPEELGDTTGEAEWLAGQNDYRKLYSNDILGQRLREMRLWHWCCVLKYRKIADGLRVSQVADNCKSHIKYFDKAANMHLGYVQTLNDFFPFGDTAEADAAKEDNNG